MEFEKITDDAKQGLKSMSGGAKKLFDKIKKNPALLFIAGGAIIGGSFLLLRGKGSMQSAPVTEDYIQPTGYTPAPGNGSTESGNDESYNDFISYVNDSLEAQTKSIVDLTGTVTAQGDYLNQATGDLSQQMSGIKSDLSNISDQIDNADVTAAAAQPDKTYVEQKTQKTADTSTAIPGVSPTLKTVNTNLQTQAAPTILDHKASTPTKTETKKSGTNASGTTAAQAKTKVTQTKSGTNASGTTAAQAKKEASEKPKASTTSHSTGRGSFATTENKTSHSTGRGSFGTPEKTSTPKQTTKVTDHPSKSIHDTLM